MTLPDRALFTLQEACDQLSVSKATMHRLINDGQLTRVHPRPRAARITRESLAALLERSADQTAMKATSAAQAQARAAAQQGQQQERKKSLFEKWGLLG